MNLIPKKDIINHASQAVDAIESTIDTRIWRTRLRINELILRGNKDLKNNPFITNQNAFLYMLLTFGFKGAIQTLKGQDLYTSGEQFEEGDSQPVLYGDLQEKSGEPYTYISESIYQRGMTQGEEFEQIKERLGYNAALIIPRIKSAMISLGMPTETVFYKKPIGKNDNHDMRLPMLPATIN